MRISFITFRSNVVLGITFKIYFDADFNEYQVRSTSNTILFRADSEALAFYGIRTYHVTDYCGKRLTEAGLK